MNKIILLILVLYPVRVLAQADSAIYRKDKSPFTRGKTLVTTFAALRRRAGCALLALAVCTVVSAFAG